MPRWKGEKYYALWENARIITADVPLDREAAKKILPLGMRLSGTPRATLFIADYTKTVFTIPYREAALLIHVATPFGRGVHCPWMLVDDDTALIYGRELLGYPKKMGSFAFHEGDGKITATVARHGINLISMEITLGEKEADPSPMFDVKTFNAGGLGQFFYFNPIRMFRAREVIHESHSGKITLHVFHSANDPIAELIAGDPVNGRYVIMDIIGGRYMLPVGIAGPLWLKKVFSLRFE